MVAKKTGFSDSVADSLVLSLGEKKRVDLVLQAPPFMTASPGTMEFKDEPSFTVAGVTDWSNLGLHGSAASSKTSESLAKETAALKSSEPEEASAGGSSKRYQTALAYRDKGDFSAARQEVRKALANADDAEGHRLLGELDERLSEPLEAVREYQRAARMDPTEQNYFEWGTELLIAQGGRAGRGSVYARIKRASEVRKNAHWTWRGSLRERFVGGSGAVLVCCIGLAARGSGSLPSSSAK